jgi:DNA polymerase III subunit delta
LLRQKLNETISRYKAKMGSDIGLDKFDSSTSKAEAIVAAITAAPLLVEHRLVVVEDISKNKLVAEELLKSLERVPESTVVIFHEREPDKRTSFFKSLSKAAKAVEFKELDESQTRAWLKKTASELEAEIEPAAVSQLLELVGTDQWKLGNELQKLASFNKTINQESVSKLVVPSFEKTIFDLVEAVTGGELAEALRLYDGLRRQRQEPIYILSMIGWQLHALVVAKASEGRPQPQVAAEQGVSPYTLRKAAVVAARLELAQLKLAAKSLVAADMRLKSSAGDPDAILEQLITGLASVFKTSARVA